MVTMDAVFGIALGTVLLCAQAGMAQEAKAERSVAIRFWGQACFTITTDGKTLLTDPFSPQIGYSAFDVAPEVVTISHDHFDHGDTSWVKGKPLILHGLGEAKHVQAIDQQAGPFHVRAVAARHWRDPAQKARGEIAIFVIEVAGLKIVHVGDLGEPLSPEQVEAIGRPDVLLVPVGGFYTVDPDQAYEVVQQLKPRAYVIPMHFRTPLLEAALQSRLAEPGAFLRKFGDKVIRPDGNELKISPASPPGEMKAVLLGYKPSSAGAGPATSQPASSRDK